MVTYVPPPDPQGKLIVENRSPTRTEVYFIPDDDRLAAAHLDLTTPLSHKIRVLTFNSDDGSITIEPKNTLHAHPNFLGPKYDQIERIRIKSANRLFEAADDLPETVDDVIEVLSDFPSGFTKNPDFGLGLGKEYRFVIDTVEELSDCTILDLTTDETRVDESKSTFYISAQDFDDLRRTLNSITRLGQNAARSVKTATTHNKLAKKIGAPGVEVNAGRHPVRRMITAKASGKEILQEDEQDAVIHILSQSAKAMGEAQTEKLAKLQSEIELVTLETLIERYTKMMSKNLKENSWQSFFNENPFILNMAFGYPVIKVQDQASVGGRKLSGSGEKITDFLVKNSLTNNTAIFEIKTPKAALLNKTPFREGVYTPSTELSGSINQALDQKYQFQGQIAQIKNASRIYDIESYSIHCCLIVGTKPSGDDQLKSFELFRRNSKDVEIVTFDEL